MQAAAELKETGAVLFAVGLRYPTYVYFLPLSKTWGENYFAALKTGFVPRWEELHALASEPMESHVFFAEHFHDAVNGLYTTLSTFSVCNATPQGQTGAAKVQGEFSLIRFENF